jgi:hypothetical protein
MDVIMVSFAERDALTFAGYHDFHPKRFLASVLDNVRDRFGCSHLAYRCVLSLGDLPHFALGLLFFLCARVDGFPVR